MPVKQAFESLHFKISRSRILRNYQLSLGRVFRDYLDVTQENQSLQLLQNLFESRNVDVI